LTRLGHAHWEALGTSVELLVTDGAELSRASEIVESELDAVDRACSRFRADSDLCRVNAQAGRTVQTDPLLIEAVEVALRAAELTGGDVDPTLGVALELAGYDRDWRLLAPARSGVAAGRRHSDREARGERRFDRQQSTGGHSAPRPRVIASLRPGWGAVELDRERATIRIPAGVKLDLGATAKAWAADRASRAVEAAIGGGVLVSLGGDISAAGPAPERGWRIHVTDDHRSGPNAPGQTIAITGGGLATSSTTVRRWQRGNNTMHHILDPATGAPSRGRWRTVSVAAIDCADANVAATAAIVRGAEACEWLAELDLPARLVAHDGEVVTVGSWPGED
jgi:thiamine biosynthesis lipoprotein